jgi:glycine dehydrogenase subunit 1
MPYIPHTDRDREEMLAAIGVGSVEELLEAVPEGRRYPRLELGRALSEPEVLRLMMRLSERNRDVDHSISFMGAGAYNHYIPAAVSRITGRSEFYTAYTPYQAEVSQGTLQSIYEFQTMIANLMGMDVANASMYDGATAAAEGALLAVHFTRRKKVLVSRSFHPEWLRVLRTYTSGMGLEIQVVGDEGEPWKLDVQQAREALDDRTAALLVQYPNFFGHIEDVRALADAAHEAGALLVVSAYPIALGLLKSPGELGADIATGEGQPLGTELNYGGPYLGLFATRDKYVRYMPGRLVGATKDLEGNKGYVLTLQTREQHIRREKATSNICTNEALNALAATVYLSLMGRRGLPEVARLCLNNAHYLAEGIGGLPGWEVVTPETFFNEFVVRCPVPAAEVVSRLLEQDILAGVPLDRFMPAHADKLLVCATEMNTRAEMDRYLETLSRVSQREPAAAR